MNILTSLLSGLSINRKARELPDEQPVGARERGLRPTDESRLRQLYNDMVADPQLRAAIFEIRAMDRRDGRVRKIHTRTARAATRGALQIVTETSNKRLISAWADFEMRLGLWNRQKLESDFRGLMMEGNLPIQWVLDERPRVVAGVRMPTETIRPRTGANGRFVDLSAAYEQWDLLAGRVIATWPLWQLTMVRLAPDNYDDLGSFGRPYLDSAREIWRKLVMTEEDLVIRRRERAPMRTAHFLEGATEEDLEAYRQRVEGDQKQIASNFYSNRKGSVQAIQGDANLDQIADVAHLLDTFFSGAPAPKALFGYAGDLNRDILADLAQDYFDELEAMQDIQAMVYELGFRLDLLLAGINPDAYEFDIKFAERRVETPTQAADRALKLRTIGVPYEMCWKIAGMDPAEVRRQIDAERESADPYPDAEEILGARPSGQNIRVIPGQGGGGESATTITARR